jgi:hypothetical protein
MLYSQPKGVQKGGNVSEKQVKQNEGRARDVAKEELSADEAPGGPVSTGSSVAPLLATFDSPGVVGASRCRIGDTSESLGSGTKRIPELGYFRDDPDLSLEQFVFTCTPHDIPSGDYQDCWDPKTLMAYWDDDSELIVADSQTDDRFRVICFEQQRRGRSRARSYWTWYCKRISPLNGCDADFMKEISS